MLKFESLRHIPEDPWVYFFKNSVWWVLYIGKAKNLHKRLSQYFSPWSIRKQDMLAKATSVDFMITDTEHEALILEDNLIKKYLPEYNRLLKADNSYVYIKITRWDWPQIFLTRSRSSDGAIYIWPKSNRMILAQLLQYFRQIFKYRWCKNALFQRGALCSDYLFGLCKWRCVMAKLSQRNASDYQEVATKIWFDPHLTHDQGKSESHDMIKKIVQFFEGKTNAVTDTIKSEIQWCIETQNFEWAAKLRDLYQNISKFVEKQQVVIDPSISWYFILIHKIWQYRVSAIIQFHAWKLVDVLRFKDIVKEVDMDELIKQYEREFGTCIHLQDMTDDKAFLSCSSKKVLKAVKITIMNHLENAINSYIQSDSRQTNSVMNDILTELQQRYALKRFPYRIECLDISHLSWSYASWGISCLVAWLPYKKWYRQYRIQRAKWWDDYDSLREVMIRKFALESNDRVDTTFLPDIFVLDGGIWQFNIISWLIKKYPKMQLIVDYVQFCSLGKWEARSSWSRVYWAKEELFVLGNDIHKHEFRYDQTDKLLITARDEAHRFANRYREKQMSKQREW